MNSIDIQTTLLQADWRACLAVWTERVRGPSTSWKSALWWALRRFEQPSAPDEAGIVLGPATMRFDTAGISIRQGLLHVVHDWESVREGTATPEHLFLWIERSSVIIVPIRSLLPGMPLMEFQSKLDLMHEAASRRRLAAVSGAAKDRSAPRTRMAAATSLVDS